MMDTGGYLLWDVLRCLHLASWVLAMDLIGHADAVAIVVLVDVYFFAAAISDVCPPYLLYMKSTCKRQ